MPVGTKFCANCGASTTAPLPIAPHLQAMPSHTKRNLAVVVILVIVLAVAASASSRNQSQNPTSQTTTTQEFSTGGTVIFDQAFDMKMGSDEVPVEITFNGTWYERSAGYYQAESGYKYFALQIRARSMGIKETFLFSPLSIWEVSVDKGYLYQAKFHPFSGETIKPEEVKSDVVAFEILESTTPLEVRYYDTCLGSTSTCSPTFVLNLRGLTIPLKEELTIQSSYSCIFHASKANLLNVTNSGLALVTIASVYYAGQMVSSSPTTVQPGETVSIAVTIPSSVQSGFLQEYEVKVVTTQGSTFTSSCYYVGS